MDANKSTNSQPRSSDKKVGMVRNISEVITDILTEPESSPEPVVSREPVPPELVADAVGWAPSMPPGPLLLDLAAHDPHQTRVPLSEAKTMPPMDTPLRPIKQTKLSPPENLRNPDIPLPRRRLKPQVVIITGSFVGAIVTVLAMAALWISYGLNG
jgi:hypothetical protein